LLEVFRENSRLVTCTKNKHKGVHKAEYLYSKSDNFKRYLSSARLLTENENIFVISALHKLVPLYKEIECYDYALSSKTPEEVAAWGKAVADQLMCLYDFSNTRFVILADDDYSSALQPFLPNTDLPLNGIGCGHEGYSQLDLYISNLTK